MSDEDLHDVREEVVEKRRVIRAPEIFKTNRRRDL